MKGILHFEKLEKTHGSFHQKMFYESLFVPPGDPPFSPNIIHRPSLQKYWKDWGGPTDHGLVVMLDHILIGAAWARFSNSEDPGYGYVSDEYPELGIALLEEYRGKGIGNQLVVKLLDVLKLKNVPGVSLSADLRNQALRLYERLGFEVVQETGNSVVMLLIF